jgi:four helix bundle protein
LPKRTTNFEIGKQLVRSASSVRANYIEANDSLSKKDFIMRVKISKKEAKESRYWINLSTPNKDNERNKIELMCEIDYNNKQQTGGVRSIINFTGIY